MVYFPGTSDQFSPARCGQFGPAGGGQFPPAEAQGQTNQLTALVSSLVRNHQTVIFDNHHP